jgi:alcohol dehydrogenase
VKAVVYSGPGTVEVADVAEPRVEQDDDAIVAVTSAAICGTDLHVTSGDAPGMEPGTVLGHEFTGTVVDAGAGVRTLRPGDQVMTSDFTACGRCWWCHRGCHWHCGERRFFGTGAAFGPPLAGGQAELVRVPHADVTLARRPATITTDAALLAGDNLAAGWEAIRRSDVGPGAVVTVVGGGPVGQLASLAAQVHGAAVVVVSDPVPERREMAAAHGAVAVEPDRVRQMVDSVTAGRGSDAVVEAVGRPLGLDAALALVRPGGTVASVSAHTEPRWALPLARTFAAELSLRFVVGDPIPVLDVLTTLIEAGVLDPDFVVTRHAPLDRAAEGYREMREARQMKVVLDLVDGRR